MLNIKYKILALAVGIPLFLVLIFGYFTLNYATQQLEEFVRLSVASAERSMIEKTQFLAELDSASISNYLSNRISEVVVYANMPKVKTMDWYGSIKDYYVSEYKRSNGIYEKMLLGTPEGYYYTTADNGTGNKFFGGLQSDKNSDPNSKLKSITDRDYWQFSIKGETGVSDPMISKTTGAKQIMVATPVKNDSGNIIGMTSLSLELKTIEEKMKGFTRSGGYVFLLSKKGEYISHPDESLIINLKRDDKGNVMLDEHGNQMTNNPKITDSKNAGLADIGRKMIAHETGYEKFSESGTNYYLMYAPVQASGYSLGIVIPESLIFKDVRAVQENGEKSITALRNNIIILTLIGIILSAIFALFLSSRITKPITILRNAAVEIGKGNLDKKIEVKTKDEIGELAKSFGQMTSDLKKSRKGLEDYAKNLEEKVGERTKELQEKIEEMETFNRLAVGRELKMVELKEEIKRLKEESEKTKGRK